MSGRATVVGKAQRSTTQHSRASKSSGGWSSASRRRQAARQGHCWAGGFPPAAGRREGDMQAESGIVPDFEVGEEFHEEPKTYYELKSQPLKNR